MVFLIMMQKVMVLLGKFRRFASSTQNLQLQRGVGTSTNGSGAFGASLNILTDAISEEAYGEIRILLGLLIPENTL
jgi:hypothetical protein